MRTFTITGAPAPAVIGVTSATADFPGNDVRLEGISGDPPQTVALDVTVIEPGVDAEDRPASNSWDIDLTDTTIEISDQDSNSVHFDGLFVADGDVTLLTATFLSEPATLALVTLGGLLVRRRRRPIAVGVG